MTNKIFMENSYIRELEARVISKEYVNGKYHLKLDRTIFYPHLVGGQPRDLGTINGIEVDGVYEDKGDIGHIIREDLDARLVQLSIDWDHRFDMMQQHSGQHILSSAFYRLLDANTVGFYISKDYMYIDLDLDDISEEEISRVEYLSNKIIQSNFKMKSYFLDRKTALKLPLIKLPTVKENIRIVEIDHIDYNPCGGTHVNNTGEVGLIKIRKWYKSRGNIRLEFICGNRGLEDYSRKTRYIKEVGQILSAKDKDIVYKTKSLYHKKEDLEQENRYLREELSKYKGEYFLKDKKHLKGINYIIKIIDGVDLKEINNIAHYLNDDKNLIQVYGLSNGDSAQFLISRSHDLDIDLKDILNIVKEHKNIKGGGSSQIIQGGIGIGELQSIINLFFEEIKEYYKTI